MCLLCEEKAKAIDKVETQESAATAIQGPGTCRPCTRFQRRTVDASWPRKVAVLLERRPGWMLIQYGPEKS